MTALALAREQTVAAPGFNRWSVPPAALAIHLCIGQAYAFSVFNLPLSRALGVTGAIAGDWKLTELGWIFTLAIVFLGLSAAFGGRWLERAGPRRSGLLSATLWATGFLLGSLGVHLHQLWLLYLGYGVVGGCGLGLGYITPVSTLIKWFPDRRGMATGLAIMGFGGGAMIASPLSELLMRHFASPSSVGVKETFLVLGALYLVSMLAGALSFRVPPPGWAPAGYRPTAASDGSERSTALITRHHVHPDEAIKTPQFYLLWTMLFVNVTAGIGVLGQASAMIQEVFRGRIGAGAAAGFVGLLSLFNMAGRFLWASASDRLGRRTTYALFFLLGPLLYALVPLAGGLQSAPLFVACFAAVMTMYGGGFATIPAYLADLFGTQYVGAIHGRLLTAWSAAGVAGPVLVNYLREYQLGRGVERAQVYNFTMYLMAALLLVGFAANLAVRAVDARHYDKGTPVTPESPADHRDSARGAAVNLGATRGWTLVALGWLAVLAPLAWGVTETVRKALALFR